MPSRAMTAAEEADIEQTVRQVLGEVLNEVSDELSEPAEESPSSGRRSRASTRRTARGAESPESPGNGAVPPDVSEAVETVLQNLSPEQAQTLVSLFETIGEHGDEEGEPETSAAGDASLELGSMKAAKARGETLARGGRIGAIIRLLKKSRQLYRASVRAAKGGRGSFNKWVNGLSNFHPAKWAIKALPDVVLYELITWLASQGESVASGRAMAGMRAGDAEPEEIEHVVRRVLSEALTEPQGGLSAH